MNADLQRQIAAVGRTQTCLLSDRRDRADAILVLVGSWRQVVHGTTIVGLRETETLCARLRWPTFVCISGGAAVGGRDARQTVRPVQGAGGQGGAGVGRGGGSAGCGNGRSRGGRRRQRPVALRRWEVGGKQTGELEALNASG